MYTTLSQLYELYLQFPEISTDTRHIKKNSIFFALKGDTFNGNEFASEAIEKGCKYAIIDNISYKKNDRFLLVNDVLKSLQKLAWHHRNQLSIPIIGITGSNGKTTTKELIASVLEQKYTTFATKGNLNNHIGVPLSILSIQAEHQVAVIEMGANHVGEIAQLCEMVQPTHGIITNIGKAHLEGFGGKEGVIKGKSELYSFIRKNEGTLFVNEDDELLLSLSKNSTRISYGTSEDADWTGRLETLNPFITLSCGASDWEEYIQIETKLIGKYNFENILAAGCIGNYFDVEAELIKKGIEQYEPSNNRSQLVKKGDNTILLDAYNANPTSMSAAIENFSAIKADKKLLILGDMLELGDESVQEHENILNLLKEKELTKALLVGKIFSKSNKKFASPTFLNTEEAIEWIKNNEVSNTSILIKGSRGMQLEKILEVL